MISRGTMISVKITPEKTFKNPEEKFINDLDNRFGGHFIIEDETNLPFSYINRTCSKSELRAWIDQWISENCDLNNDFKVNVNVFLENQFKRAQKQ